MDFQAQPERKPSVGLRPSYVSPIRNIYQPVTYRSPLTFTNIAGLQRTKSPGARIFAQKENKPIEYPSLDQAKILSQKREIETLKQQSIDNQLVCAKEQENYRTEIDTAKLKIAKL